MKPESNSDLIYVRSFSRVYSAWGECHSPLTQNKRNLIPRWLMRKVNLLLNWLRLRKILSRVHYLINVEWVSLYAETTWMFWPMIKKRWKKFNPTCIGFFNVTGIISRWFSDPALTKHTRNPSHCWLSMVPRLISITGYWEKNISRLL